MKRIGLLTILAALAGCTAVWGASYHMVTATPDMVQYEYELGQVNTGGMEKAAQKYCGATQKVAVLSKTERGGYNYINTYRCMPAMDIYSVQPF